MGSSALKVAVILAISSQIGFFTPVLAKYKVVIINILGENKTLNLHCQSKDDDLGVHYVPYAESFEWRFNVNIWRTTLFYCDMGWGDLKGHFDVFDAKRDMKRCNYEKCIWLVTRDGLDLYIKAAGNYVHQFDWPK
ncbi:S-protein homolog 5 [Ziziphus jujuba]|uniref:S-protein homolog n=1 Tax=Ziziphus jujuba TaxID=326968 RepID=A0A6P6GAY9_ZIZJJ|nr:S-protein homolog 5 [Ziziphus jujuba]